jgi:hypothetical protein
VQLLKLVSTIGRDALQGSCRDSWGTRKIIHDAHTVGAAAYIYIWCNSVVVEDITTYCSVILDTLYSVAWNVSPAARRWIWISLLVSLALHRVCNSTSSTIKWVGIFNNHQIPPRFSDTRTQDTKNFVNGSVSSVTLFRNRSTIRIKWWLQWIRVF